MKHNTDFVVFKFYSIKLMKILEIIFNFILYVSLTNSFFSFGCLNQIEVEK